VDQVDSRTNRNMAVLTSYPCLSFRHLTKVLTPLGSSFPRCESGAGRERLVQAARCYLRTHLQNMPSIHQCITR